MKIEETTRQQIAKFLPEAIATALRSYHLFSQREIGGEDKEDKEDSKEGKKESGTKAFVAHHSACKTAIAHIELLIKLAKWAELPDAGVKDGNGQIMLSTMIQEAQEELDGYRERHPGEEKT